MSSSGALWGFELFQNCFFSAPIPMNKTIGTYEQCRGSRRPYNIDVFKREPKEMRYDNAQSRGARSYYLRKCSRCTLKEDQHSFKVCSSAARMHDLAVQNVYLSLTKDATKLFKVWQACLSTAFFNPIQQYRDCWSYFSDALCQSF